MGEGLGIQLHKVVAREVQLLNAGRLQNYNLLAGFQGKGF